VELILFQPVNGANTQYGQLYKPISAHPFKEAGIKGFAPIQPYKVASNLAITIRCAASHWPSGTDLTQPRHISVRKALVQRVKASEAAMEDRKKAGYF
jgi:hypothetical protein